MTAVHWYVARGGHKVGPFTPADLQQLAKFGLLQPSEMLWREGLSKWVEASTIAALFPAPTQKRYWLALADKPRGPFGIDQIRAALASRQLTLESLVCPEHGKEWAPLAQLTEFRGLTPSAVSPSQARLLTGSLDAEEAELYLAGKSGDTLARLITVLLDSKKAHASNPALAESLEKTIEVLRSKRAESESTAPSRRPD